MARLVIWLALFAHGTLGSTLEKIRVPSRFFTQPSHCASFLRSQLQRKPDDSVNGLVTDSLKMDLASLKAGYRRGIFPWLVNERGNALWYSPPQRGVLEFANLHISSSDRKYIRQTLANPSYQVTFDRAFLDVMRECQRVKRWQFNDRYERVLQETWIKDEFVEAYHELHENGLAHSVEVWRDGKLVAGLYGTFIDGVFTGESMFHHESDAVKLALFALIERLKANGHTFIDTQQAVGLSAKWGAREVPRDQFLLRLRQAQQLHLKY